jgi:hypothetical protein
MKNIKFIFLFFGVTAILSCKKLINQNPQSNLSTATYYKNADEVLIGLNGAYNGLQKSMFYEWQMTELRSDNSKMGVPSSNNTVNRDLSDLDLFIPSTAHTNIYNYWLATYNNIRNANVILLNLGINYDAGTGTISLGSTNVVISDSLRKQYGGEALFLRACSYFNLVRLFGGVFLIDKPIAAEAAKAVNRSSVAEIYKFIKADLLAASTYLTNLKFTQLPAVAIGRANAWSAKGLLAKMYLTLNQKADAITLLNDILTNSGYALQLSFANIFSINNEMNSEILFSVRYKAGNLGLGSSFGNDFAPLGSGASVINGSGLGWNFPTNEIDTLMGITTPDPRKASTVLVFGTATPRNLYVKKYLTPVVTTNDGESDWPVLRYSDIILMLAEAQGFTPSSISLINSIRTRAGLTALPATVNTVALFEQALSTERRIEFAFENQRWFDLVRFNTTLTTITAEQTIVNHITKEFAKHYAQYSPVIPLATLLSNVTANKLLLPIPQREIDTNTQLAIAQNPGY